MTLDAVRQAERVYRTKGNLDRQQKVDEVISMHEWQVFSNRHLATLTGLRPAFVNELTGKTDRTGGTMNPKRLGTVAEVIVARGNGEDVKERVRELSADGFSGTMIARLTGIPGATVARWVRG